MPALPHPGHGRRALVVGGTGPTGPDIARGLVERGFHTTVFHSGRHEVPLPDEVAHIHGDAHFSETIAEALDGHHFDVVLAQYGRLRHLVDYFAGNIDHIVAIGGMSGPLLPADAPEWGPLGKPAIVPENRRLLLHEPSETNKLGYRIAEAARHLFEVSEERGTAATYIAYPPLYGPRQPGSPEWWAVRRVRDGRRRFILPDGGLRIESRAYVHNVSQAPLLVLDKPDVAAGRTYVVTDEELFTTRQRIEHIAHHMGADIDIVSLPYELATPAHPYYRLGPEHRAGLGDLIRQELGYVDTVPVAEALGQTVDWLLENPEAIDEIEKQLGDPFDYEHEDRLLEWWDAVVPTAPAPHAEFSYSHMYRHPKRTDEST